MLHHVAMKLAGARSLCVAAYVVAGAAAWAALRWGPTSHPFWSVALADVVATVVIFGFSRALVNSSFYDAYWSVAPICIAAYWTVTSDPSPRAWWVTTLVTAWGIRLTYNWASHWRGLEHEDWRYVDLRRQTGAAYWAVSFAGIHMFPTVMVLACCGSLYVAVTHPAPANLLDGVAAIVTVGAIVIETLADRQLHRFTRSGPAPETFMASGLWRWSRHPNYFGEVSFWWGLWLFGLAADPSRWWTVIGPLALTAMFLFISIPMIEKRMLAKRPLYAAHQKRTSRLVPLPPSG